jgi:hypothetical protein
VGETAPSEDSKRSFGAVVGLGTASEPVLVLGVAGEITEESGVEAGAALFSWVTVDSVGSGEG